jgi:hypothetical protein
LCLVAIIAFFVAGAHNPIAAARQSTRIRARIRVHAIAVVTTLTLIHAAIAAGFTATLRIATVPSSTVAIITGFALIHTAIAATLDLTDPIAAIASVGVAIITGFNTRAHHTITAGCQRTAI